MNTKPELNDTLVFDIQGAGCASCVGKIEKSLISVPGVRSAEMNFADLTVTVVGDTAPETLIASVSQAGYSAKHFVPAIMIISIISALVWFDFGPQSPIALGIISATTVLIIACPCALGLATPMSVMVGMGKAAEAGVLIRNGEALQTASQITAMVLDKTRTITEGKPSVIDIVPAGDWNDTDLLRLAGSLEAGSEHPLAAAIVEAAKARGLLFDKASDFHAHSGSGVEGRAGDYLVLLGNQAFTQAHEINVNSHLDTSKRLAAQEKTPIFLAIDGYFAGIIAIAYPFFGVLLSPIIAGGAMAFSSLTVVGNANRLRLFKAQSR